MIKGLSSEKIWAIVFCFLTTFIYSGHFLAAKEVLKVVDPLSLSAVRGILGGLLILFYFRQRISGHINWENLKKLAFIGFLGFYINQIFFMFGLDRTSPLNASIITNTIPLASTLLAFLFLIERFSWRKVSGVILGFGMIFVLMMFKSKSAEGSSALGDFLMLLNVLSFSLAFILAKRMMGENFPHELMSGGMLVIGGTFLLLTSLNETVNTITYSFENWKTFGLMFFEIFFSTTIVYLLNFKALQILDPSQTTIFIYLQPIFTAIMDYAFFRKLPTLVDIPIFIGIIIAGYLVLRDGGGKKKVTS